MNLIFSFGFTQIWRKSMIHCITKQPIFDQLNVIDLMTGMGETWNLAYNYFPNSNLSGIDISDGMLSKAENKNIKLYKNKIKLYNQDVLNNDIPSESFDIVICAFGLKTFDLNQISNLAIQVERILKPGGKFSFIEISKPSNFLLNAFYKFYLGKITPIITWIFMGNPSEYKMLWKYIINFSNAKNATEIFKNSGLKATYKSYFYGCATGFSGEK